MKLLHVVRRQRRVIIHYDSVVVMGKFIFLFRKERKNTKPVNMIQHIVFVILTILNKHIIEIYQGHFTKDVH